MAAIVAGAPMDDPLSLPLQWYSFLVTIADAMEKALQYRLLPLYISFIVSHL